MIKIAVIGAGGWGFSHVKNVFEDKRAEPVAFIDRNPEALLHIQKELGIKPELCFESLDAAMQKVKFDAATLSVPNPHRNLLITKLMQKNIHCLMDKPAAHTPKDLAIIKAAADKSKAMLMVAENYRFLDAAYKIKRIIQGREGGKLNSLTINFCRQANFLTEGFYRKLQGPQVIALEIGSHHIDLANYFIGSHPIRVEGETWREKTDLIQGHCHLKAQLEYEGKLMVYYSSTLMGGSDKTSWPGSWDIDCDRSHIIWDENSTDRIKVFGMKGVGSSSDGGYKNINAKSYPEKSLLRCYESFLSAIEGTISTDAKACMFNENLKTIMTGLAIHESAKKQQKININQFCEKSLKQ